MWGGCVPIPTGGGAQKFLDFASQIATFGEFWALSFNVRMHVLHIKISTLDLKSAAKFTNWGGLSSRTHDTRNSLMENMLCLFSTIRCN